MTIKEGFITPDPNANPFTQGKQEVPIAPISTWPLGIVSSVLVFPTALDQERLEKAFARALSFWPAVCGRFVKSSSPNAPEFSISLTQSPIPFSTQTTTDEYPYANKNVVQDSLGDYIPPLADDFAVPGADAALIAVRLSSLADGSSVLGVNWGHILGDAASFSRFIEDVSLFYNLPSAELEEDMPTFEPHVNIPEATDAVRKDFAFGLLRPITVQEMMKGYSSQAAQSQKFTITLTRDELAHITAARYPGDQTSDNDLICGWWISVLERAGMPIDHVVQTINYRRFHQGHPDFPPNLPTLVANVAQMRETILPNVGRETPLLRTAAAARSIHSSRAQLRSNPDFMLQWLSYAADALKTAAHEGLAQCLVPPVGTVVLNSNLRYDWAIKFGQPSANYHTDTSIVRFLRVFQANPRPGADADGQRDVELVFRVPFGGAAHKVRHVFDGDRERWASGPIEEHEEEQPAPPPPVLHYGLSNRVAQQPWGGN